MIGPSQPVWLHPRVSLLILQCLLCCRHGNSPKPAASGPHVGPPAVLYSLEELDDAAILRASTIAGL